MFLLYHLLVIIPFFHFSYSVSEPLCILTSFPLRDSSKWIYREKHQEELPCDAPVHGEISSNWSPGCTRQPEIRVTDLCQVPLEYIFTCQSSSKLQYNVYVYQSLQWFWNCSSETGEELASSSGIARAIFSPGFCNGTGDGGVLWKYIDENRSEGAQN